MLLITTQRRTLKRSSTSSKRSHNNRRARRILWIDHDRFETKPDKSTWLEMAEVLTGHGYDVSILTYGRSTYRPEGFKVAILYFFALDFPGIFRFSLLLNILFWLLRHARAEDIIIVDPDGLIIAPILRLFGKRNIHLDIRTLPAEINSLKRRMDQWLFWKIPMMFFCGMASGYSFITNHLRIAVEREFGTSFDEYVLWQSGVNQDRFRPTAKIARHKNNHEFILLYHGTISQKRGIGAVIEAMARLDDRYRSRIRFVLVGTGPGLDQLANLTSERGISDRVVFNGFLPYEQIPDEILKADCCVCPLPPRPEWNVSSPLKIFEYMACAKPMILTPILAHKDVCNKQDFVVWTNGEQADDFVRAIQYAYDNRVALSKAAAKAPSLIRANHEWGVQGEKLVAYFARIFP